MIWLQVLVIFLVATALFVALLPWIFMPLVRLVLMPRYGFRRWGLENLPRRGAVVIIANHATWLDGFFLGVMVPRRAKALVNAGFLGNPVLRWFAERVGLIPVPFTGPKAQKMAIQACRKVLDKGGVVAIFPEGQLTRNGFVGPFYRGLELILRDRDHVPVVPVYLDNLWGSLWGFSGGRCFRKPVQGLRRVIGVNFGPPIPGPINLFRVRQGLLEASVLAVTKRLGKPELPESVDLALPHFTHPKLGLLTASAPDFESAGAKQLGVRQGTVGHPLPGVAIRSVDDSGEALPVGAVGRLQGLVAGQSAHWLGLGHRGSVDVDGFVRVL